MLSVSSGSLGRATRCDSVYNLLGSHNYYGLPEARNMDLARWEPYVRFKTSMNFHYVNYYDSADESKWMYNSSGKKIREIAAISLIVSILSMHPFTLIGAVIIIDIVKIHRGLESHIRLPAGQIMLRASGNP